MRTTDARSETFEVDLRSSLVREVTPASGRPYRHRCTLTIYKEVAHLIDAAAERGVTLEELIEASPIPMPMTQAAVALAFLKERGCVTVEGRRSYPASDWVYEDAMIEYHALCDERRR